MPSGLFANVTAALCRTRLARDSLAVLLADPLDAGTDWDRAATLLSEGASASLADPLSGQTLLMRAAFEGNKKWIRTLICSQFVDPNARDAEGNCAAIYAVRGKQADILQDLSTNGADIFLQNEIRENALMLAADLVLKEKDEKKLKSRMAVFTNLLKRIQGSGSVALVEVCSLRDKEERTVFHKVARRSERNAPILLEKLYATYNGNLLVGPRVETPFMLAAERGLWKNIEAMGDNWRGEDRDANGSTILHRIASAEGVEEGELIKTIETATFIREDYLEKNTDGKLAFQLAQEKRNEKVAAFLEKKTLLALGEFKITNPWIESKTFLGETLLATAADSENADVLVPLALKYKADPNAICGTQEINVLFSLAYDRAKESAWRPILDDPRTDLSICNLSGENILLCSIPKNRDLTFALLERKDVDFDCVDQLGATPLRTALAICDFKLARKIAEAGATVDLRDKRGETPLFAFCKGEGRRPYYPNIIKLLLKLGADPLAENDKGETPLSVAEKRGDMDLVALLKKALAKREEPKSPRKIWRGPSLASVALVPEGRGS